MNDSRLTGNHVTRFATAVCCGLLVACAVPDVEAFAGYREATLDNGLRVILIEHRANPMVASSVVVGAGVIHEPEGMNGASHLLEHLLFNGTTTRTQKQLYDDVDRLGAYNNATTREDHTLFSLLIQKEFIDKGLEIQADMLFRSTIPPENFDKEKGIVLEEMARDEGDPGYRAAAAFRKAAFASTPLARPVLGTRDSIGGIGRDALWAYYKARYVPSNMVLIVLGDFDIEPMLEIVRRTFGSAPAGSVPEGRPRWPARPENNLVTTALDAERIYVSAAIPLDLAPHDPLMPAIELLVAAAAGSDDAPLRRLLTSGADPAALSASLSVTPREAPWSTLDLDAVIPVGKRYEPVLDALASVLRDLRRGGAARGRIEAIRARAVADDVVGADQIHYYVLMRSSYVLGAPDGYLDRASGRFEAVTEADLDAAAARLEAGLRDLRISVAGPGIADSAVPWTPKAARAEARPASTRAEISRTLASGIEVALQRNDDSQVFAMHLLFRPRSASEPEGKEGIASFLHRLMARGTLVQDSAALAARLDALGANLKTDDDARVPYDDYYTTPEFSFVRLEMPSARWREGVALLAEIVRYPRLDQEDVEAVRREMLDIQSRRADSSRTRAVEIMDRTLAPGHALSRPVLGTAASIGSISVDDLKAFHKSYVTGRRLIVTGVSPVAPGALLEAIENAFAGLPSGPETTPVPGPPLTGAGPEQREPPRGKGSSTIVLSYLFDAPEEAAAPLAVAGAIVSDRLTFHLREERGLAYSMGASIQPWGGRMRFQVVMGTRRENLDEALKGLREGIATFAPPDAVEVAKTSAAMRGRMLMRRLTRLNQAYYLGLERMEGRAAGSDLARIDAILRVTPDAVVEAVTKYLDPSRCRTVIAE